jgi:hypothetical protein
MARWLQAMYENSGRKGEEKAMRALIIFVLIVLLLALIGWVSFNRNGSKASINLETDRIKSDTQEMIEAGKSVLHESDRPAEGPVAQPESGPRAPVNTVRTDGTPPVVDRSAPHPAPALP